MIDVERSAQIARLRQRLTEAAVSAGGWGYHAGRKARIESTAWALLALAETTAPGSAWREFAAPHIAFLRRSQQPGGLLLDDPRLPANFTSNGLTACLAARLQLLEAPDRERLIDALVSVKGIAVDDPDPRQNNRLQGWPWLPDTFSWVEPTCWCVVALKGSRARTRSSAAAARVQEAEQLLANRSCDAGGWNYGNASALGQDLRPYVPTTALGLLALQDRPADAVVTRALAHLAEARLTEASGMALALAAIALRVFGRPAEDVEQRLAGDVDQIERTGNLQTIAMTLYALSAVNHGAHALRV